MEKKIVVFGATGNTGIEICKELKLRNINYSVFVRKGSESKLVDDNVNVVFGDVLNLSDVDSLFNKNDYTDVIIALGNRNFKAGGIRFNGTKNIINSINSNQKQIKLHVMSANGVGSSWKNLSWSEKLICKLLIPKAMKDHEQQEEIVKTNLGGYHIIRPVGLTNEKGSGNIVAEQNKVLPNKKISRSNVAKYIVKSLLQGLSGEHSICDE